MTNPKIKLSPAQVKVLEAKKGSFVSGYKPGVKLRELGLITCADGAYENCHWEISPAGLAWLAENGASAT